MDTIDTFLNAMFTPYPSTPRLVEAKTELRAMMEDAYNDAVSEGLTHNEAVGRVITEFGNLEELAPVLGIADELHAASPAPAAPTPETSDRPLVTMEEAQALLEARRSTASMLANAVALFVLAGAVFFGILSLQQTGLLAISEDGAAAIAMACATIVSAIGVLIAVQRDRSFVGVKHLTEGAFTRNPLVSSWATRQRAEYDGARTRALSIAVALWIIAPIPLMVLTSLADIFGRPTVDLSGLGLTIACVLVAVGLRIYLPTTWASATYKTLVDPDNEKHRPDGTTTAKAPRLVSVIAGPYWLLLLAGYLTWSFVADAWDRSWIVWPIGAIAFGLLSAIFESVSQWKEYRESTR